MSNQIDTLLEIARAEVGYLEKNSSAKLDDKTANAGSGNYTKFWRDMLPAWQGSPWCACYISWCARRAGIPESIIPTFYDCDAGMKWYKDNGRWHSYAGMPQPGDIVFFGLPGDSQHVGIVTAVKDGRVHTIEGNTSAGGTMIANGGAVCEKDYNLKYQKILGYGRPDYEEDEMTYEDFKKYMDQYNAEIAALPPGEWSEKERAWAEESGVIRGDTTGAKRWKSPITREEYAVTEYRRAHEG